MSRRSEAEELVDQLEAAVEGLNYLQAIEVIPALRRRIVQDHTEREALKVESARLRGLNRA